MELCVYGDTLNALVTAAALASTGHRVSLRTLNTELDAQLQLGSTPFREIELEQLLTEQLDAGRLRIDASNETLPSDVTAVFYAFDESSYEIAVELTQRLQQSTPFLIVNQSAFPVGATEALQALNQGAVVAMPEFVQEGAAVASFIRPNRLLLGCDDKQAELLVREIFRPFNRQKDHFQVMLPREAEFTKLAITGMLATRVSFMNDMAELADELGVDIESVRQGVGADPRIGEAYLYPGSGFGGLGLSQNVTHLAGALASKGVKSTLLEQVLEINERQKEVMFRKLWHHYQTDLQGKTVALWGAAFKPGTARIDNAPALALIEALWAQGANVKVHDPQALDMLKKHYAEPKGEIIYCNDMYQAAVDADALIVVTEWKPYWSPNFQQLKTEMAQPLILDGRNIYEPSYVRASGFTYYGVGR